MNQPIDCLFLHVGRSAGGTRDIVLAPLGALALADRLRKDGFSAEVLDAALLPRQSGAAITEAVKTRAPRLICVTLHWHQQCAAAAAACRELKAALPGTPLALGGYTASFFGEEAMRAIPQADFLVKGDGDAALPALLRALLRGGEVRTVPGVFVRRTGGAVAAPAGACPAGPADLAKADSTNLGVLTDSASYLRLGRETSFSERGPRPRGEATAYLAVGRGCGRACSYCGGGADALRRINSREVPAVKPAGALLRELKALAGAGIKRVYLSYDPPGMAEYYAGLFRLLRREKLSFKAYFECWRLPDAAFVRGFARTFAPGSGLAFSPDSGSRRVRARNGRGDYPNSAIERAAAGTAANGLGLKAHFTCGLPFETPADFRETLALAARLRGEYGAEISAGRIELEPCSPMHLRPANYGITLKRRTFADFTAASKGRTAGYTTPHFTEKEIQRNLRLLERLNAGRKG